MAIAHHMIQKLMDLDGQRIVYAQGEVTLREIAYAGSENAIRFLIEKRIHDTIAVADDVITREPGHARSRLFRALNQGEE